MSKYINMNKLDLPTGSGETGGFLSKIKTAGANMSTTTILVIVGSLILLGIGLYYYFFKLSPLFKTEYKANSEGEGSGQSGTDYAEIMLFYADWCPHCKTAKPIWEDVKAEYENKVINGHKVLFTEVNCTEETAEVAELMDKYKVEGFPTIKMNKDNQIIEFDAKPTKSNLTQFINTVI